MNLPVYAEDACRPDHRPGGPFEIVERELPEPGAGWVRIKVQACGICHSDSFVKEGHWPGLQYPRVPGHEVVGVVDAVGAGVAQWKPGQRVGVGWHGGHCGHCDACRSGDFFGCQVAPQITGISFDGGYADYMMAPAIALALVPEGLSAVEAAPLMCAGITTYNALRMGPWSWSARRISIQVSPLLLLSGRRSVKGWYSGTAIESQDTLNFSALAGVRSLNEVYPLEKVTEAYERMMSGKARFRVVLSTGQ